MRISQGGLRAIRIGLLAWLLTTVLVIGFGATPHAVAASTMQTHGALQRDERVGIIAHRGAAALAPENTLAAMRIAFAQGVEFVETDVHLTADGVPVLGAAAGGAFLLVSADVVTQLLPVHVVIPIGRMTGILGGLYLLWLLGRGARR